MNGNLSGLINQVVYLRKIGALSMQITCLTPSVRYAVTNMDFVLFPSGSADELSVQIETPEVRMQVYPFFPGRRA